MCAGPDVAAPAPLSALSPDRFRVENTGREGGEGRTGPRGGTASADVREMTVGFGFRVPDPSAPTLVLLGVCASAFTLKPRSKAAWRTRRLRGNCGRTPVKALEGVPGA